METDIFLNIDYKEIIKIEIKAHVGQRGYHSNLARSANCQSSFLSQVLHGYVHLTPDQAVGISTFWRLNEAQEDYFLYSVHLARSATPVLKNYYKRKMQEIKQQQQDISSRVKGDRISEGKEELLYYSNWYWSAIHVIASIQKYKTAEGISQRLRLPLGLVESCLNSLNKMGFLKKVNGRWEVTQKNLHLPRESPLIGIHHVNWRQQSGVRAGQNDKSAFHYSVVHALSFEDYEKLKSMLLDFVEKTKKIVGPSTEEEIIYLGFDCFQL
jgi:uncharacterized protein (TIGR02147 family)